MTLDEFSTYLTANTERLRYLAQSRMHQREDAEDAVQQVILKLLSAERYLPIDADRCHAFVSAALNHLIIDGWRRPCLPGGAADLGDFAEQSTSAPSDSADLDECERLVREALARLSSQERQALSLFVSEVERIVAIEKMGSGYDRALSRARAKLDEHLGNRRVVVLRLGLKPLLALLSEQSGPASTPS